VGAFKELIGIERHLLEVVGRKTADHVGRYLVRFSFLIELVNESITSTKYDYRWSRRLAEDDPRRATA
jgi:hypothetical protein